MNTISQTAGPYFLSGGGEMGEITRKLDWATTPLGTPDQWPQSLRATVGIALHSAFPQFLFWGRELTCFYNDAFRPSLGGNGKHPAVGKPGKEVWSEIWDFIGPLISKVMSTGEPAWFENQLVPFYRNGQVEDIYWTFSYSPAYGDDGKISGVFVTCTETTEKTNTLNRLIESKDELTFAIDAAELATFDYNPQTNKFSANDRLKHWFGLLPENEMDLSLAINAIAPEDKARVTEAIQSSLQYAQGGKYEIVYTIINPLTGLKRVVNARGKASFNDGQVAYRLNGTLQDITRETESRKNFEEEKERSELATAAGEFGVFEVDLATNNIIVDGRFNKIYGFKNSVSRQEYVATCHPDDRTLREEALRTGLLTGFFDYETRFFHQDGSVRWIRSKGNITYDAGKKPYKIYGVAQDTTEQKLFNKKLEDGAQQMSSIVESAPFPIGVYLGREMRIWLANKSIIDIWGKGEDVIGKLYSEILPELNHQIFKQLDKVFTTGIPIHIKNQQIDLIANGQPRRYFFNYSFTPLFNGEGKVYAVMNTAADLTELNLAQEALKKSEDNLRSTILQAPVAMCILMGPQHVVEVANRSMIELWGKPMEAVMNKPIFEGLPDARNQGLEDLLGQVYATGQPVIADERPVVLLRKGKNETVYQNFVYQAYKDAEGNISGVLAISVDVTAQVLARQRIEDVVTERTRELELANGELKRSNAELAQFAYIASHDLQEPLRKISTFSQMLEKRIAGQLDEQSKNYFNKINNASARMTALIRDVLAYSELDKQADVYTSVDLNQVVKNTITDYELLIEQKQAGIIYENLPVIKAIPLQMSQLFSNLLGNSLKFTKKEVKPVIKISSSSLSAEEKMSLPLDQSLDYISIRFADNGIGFNEDQEEKIFSIFQRLHRKSDYEGTGIGLAMCKKIALNHHGDLNVKGSSPEGAVFNFIIPAPEAE